MNLNKFMPQTSPQSPTFQELSPNIFKQNLKIRKKPSFAKIVIASLFFALPLTYLAQGPGSLDLSFDGDGIVTTPIGLSDAKAHSIAIQSDGKMVVVGTSHNGVNTDFTVTRYNADGSLDTSFDGDGIVTTDIGGNDGARSVAVQGDGKIVVVGRNNYFFTVVRYNIDGSLDISFDLDGIVTTNIGGYYDDVSVALQSDGKIVVAGTSNEDFAVFRYLTDGSLDPSFDGDGFVTTSIVDYQYVSSVALQSDGKIVVAGTYETFDDLFGPDYYFMVVRYNTDGSLDLSFRSTGILIAALGKSSSVAIQSDGKIVVAGSNFFQYSFQNFTVLRLNADGSLDASFDLDGFAINDIGDFPDYANSLAIQSDGKIVVAGFTKYSYNGTKADFAIVRYHTNGSLDNSFDLDGIVTTAIGIDENFASELAIQSDGKIVVAGYSNNGATYDFTVVRYNDTCSAIPFSHSYTICAGNSLNVGTNTYTASGTYTDTLTALISPCDSIVTTILTVSPISSTFSQSYSICDGGSISVGTNTHTASGIYTDTVIVANTCSVVTTNLTVDPISTSTQSFTICAGESINVGSNTYTTSGTYADNFMAANGCDSIVTTNLKVNPVPVFGQSLTICLGSSISIGTNVYKASGTYTDTLTSFNGCDSIVTTILKVNPKSVYPQSLSICEGESIKVGTNSYAESGIYTDTLKGLNTCTITITNLTVDPMPIVTTIISGFAIISNQNGASYQWIDCNNNMPISGKTNQSFTATANGSYAVIVNLNGCSDTSECVEISTIGISELTNSTTPLTIHPNPFSTTTTLHTDLLLQHASFTVYNALGQEVEQIGNINGQSFTFSRNNLVSGLYFCKLTQDNISLASGKLVITD